MRLFSRFFNRGDQPSGLDHRVADAARQAGKLNEKFTQAKPGLAQEVLTSLADDYAWELIENGQHLEGVVWQKFARHLSGKDPMEQLQALDDHAQLEFARDLMAAGDFRTALQAHEFLIGKHPENLDIATALSALHFQLGAPEKADAVLNGFFARQPLSYRPAPIGVKDPKTLLVLSGNDKSRFKITGEAGTYRPFRSGGHFMLSYLVDTDGYHTKYFTVSGDNVVKLPDAQPYDLLLNTIADADREHASLTTLAAYLEAHPPQHPVINHPRQVLATTRDGNYERLNGLDGFVFPRTERFCLGQQDEKTLAREIEGKGFSYPFIVREPGTHTAVTTALVANRGELLAYLAEVKGNSLYLIQFIENASPEGHYSKLRFFSIDRVLYPVVYHTDQVWNVHGSNRKSFMAANPWMLERERQFLADPAAVIGQEIYDRLLTLPDIIGLDFFGFDFTILDDGSVLIFELNPAMRHSFVHGRNFPYMMPYLQNISDAFEAMVRRRLNGAA